jgi:hypothetical protein
VFNNLERVWTRAKKNKLISAAFELNDYKFISRTKTFTLTSLGSVTNQPIDFPSGAIILSISAEASEKGKLAADLRGSLDMIRIAMDLPGQDGTLTAGGSVRASCLFGRTGERQWPEKEIVMGRQASVNLTLENLTTSILDVDVVFNALELRGQ